MRALQTAGKSSRAMGRGMTMRSRVVGSLIALAIGLLPSAARANTVFVAPESQTDTAVHGGNQAGTTDAVFTFVVPDDLQTFTRATIVTVGNPVSPVRDRPMTYSLHLSISRNLQRQDMFTNDLWNLPANAIPNTLVELAVQCAPVAHRLGCDALGGITDERLG